MATVAEVVDNAMAFLERTDLKDILLRKMPQILRTVHSYEKFNHDLTVFQFPDPTIVENKMYLQPADVPLLRDLLDIKIYSGYYDTIVGTTPVKAGVNQINQKFRNLSQGNDQEDYFGYTYAQGWRTIGTSVTIVGVSSDVKLVEALACVWPTWTYNAVLDTYTTNSWILDRYPQIIEQHLVIHGARNAQMADVLRTAENELVDIYNNFINEFTGDIYGR